MYALNSQHNRYRQQGILTANPVELIVMLYDGCIKQLKMAAMAIEENKVQQTHNCLIKAQNIVVELVSSLDFRYPIAEELCDIYEYLLRELILINAEKDAGRVDGLVGILTELRQTWHEISGQARGSATLEG